MSAVIAVDDFPSYNQEVERKAYDTLHMLTMRREKREMSDEAFVECMDTLSHAYSGVISHEFMALVDDFRNSVMSSASGITVRTFVRTMDDNFISILKDTKRGIFKVMRGWVGVAPTITVKNFKDEQNPGLEATKAFEKAADGIIKLGFDEFI